MYRILLALIVGCLALRASAQIQSPHFREATEAIGNDDLLAFKSLVEAEPALVLAHDTNVKATLLHVAASQGSDDICSFLIRKGADVNARDSVGGTPLEAAVFNDRLHVVNMLLDAGADVHLGRTRDNAFFLSLWTKDTALVHTLIEHGCSASRPDASGVLPIYVAASSGTADVIRVLLSAGADICGGRPDSCKTAWWAATDSSVEKMDFLRTLGADLNYSSGPGESVLAQALLFQHWNLARYLVRHGARVTLANDPYPPMCRIARASDDTDLASFFLRHGASVNTVQKRSGSSALMIAILNKNKRMALWLLEHGADPAIVNSDGETALALAQRYNEAEVVQALLARQR